MMTKTIACIGQLLVAAFILSAVAQALAWSESGHKIVGSIAFRQLSPDQQAKIVAILKNHPRWKEDFESKMPATLATDDEENEWLFEQMAVWPDMVKSLRGDAAKFNHPVWHYIDLPLYLTPDDKACWTASLPKTFRLWPRPNRKTK